MAAKHVERATQKPLWRDVFETAVGAVFIATIIMLFIARPFTVDGPSMQPTLETGERLLVEKLTYRFRDPGRGDIIVFRFPADPSSFFIKRVIGIPGDTIEFRDGRVFVNGHLLEEDYSNTPTLSRVGRVTVDEGHYYVLGDNRSNSQDSRSPAVGHVPIELVVGRAIVRYWPLSRAELLSHPSGVAAAPVKDAGP